MYRTERDPKIPVNVHSSKALVLAGNPIAKLDVPSIFKNMEHDYCDVTVKKIMELSENGNIYQIELESASMMPFEYIGYENVAQLGRFYSLTLGKKVTRLYTNLGCLDSRNIDFMETNGFSQKDVSLKHRKSRIIVGSTSEIN